MIKFVHNVCCAYIDSVMYITDLEEIKRISILDENKNWKFRSFLKMRDPAKIDQMVKPIYDSVLKQIDCTFCGNCCIEMVPLIKSEDLKKLESELCISKTEILGKFVSKNEFSEMELKGKPCPFLKGKLCGIYDNRPEDCVSFPHIQKKGFTTRLIGMIENMGICPIVFNVIEELKYELRFR